MYRNHGSIRARNWRLRSQNENRQRDNEKTDWSDNRSRNGDIDSDSEYRRDPDFGNRDQNHDSGANSRFQDFNNSANRNFGLSPRAENSFSTPNPTFNVPAVPRTPIH